MSNPFFVVQANAIAGEDAELNRWYEEQHLNDCLACDTAISAQRFRKVPGSGPGDYAYLALYELGDPQIFADHRHSKEGTPLLPRTPALALPAHAFFYRPIANQPALLARQERSWLYIEFLDAPSSDNATALMQGRQQSLAAEAGIGLTELMLVDDFQERAGWHADGIIFAEVSVAAGGNWHPSSVPAAGNDQSGRSGLVSATVSQKGCRMILVGICANLGRNKVRG